MSWFTIYQDENEVCAIEYAQDSTVCIAASAVGYMHEVNTLVTLKNELMQYMLSSHRISSMSSIEALVVVPDYIDIPWREYLRSRFINVGFAKVRFLTISEALVLSLYESYIEHVRRFNVQQKFISDHRAANSSSIVSPESMRASYLIAYSDEVATSLTLYDVEADVIDPVASRTVYGKEIYRFDEIVSEMKNNSSLDTSISVFIYDVVGTFDKGIISSYYLLHSANMHDVRVGASVYANVLNGYIKNLLLLQALTSSLRLETADGVDYELLSSSIIIPTKRSVMCTVGDYDRMRLCIWEDTGRGRNCLLDTLILLPNNKAPDVSESVYEVEVSVTTDAIFMICVYNKSNNNCCFTTKLQEHVIRPTSAGSIYNPVICNLIAESD